MIESGKSICLAVAVADWAHKRLRVLLKLRIRGS